MRQGNKPPVEQGQEIDVTIHAVGQKGDGIARKNGFVIFVPEAKEGKRYKIRITKVLEKVSFAQIVGEVEIPAEERIVPPPKKEEQAAEAATDDFGEEELPQA